MSADSLAWSFDARRSAPLPDCAHANCATCLRYAAPNIIPLADKGGNLASSYSLKPCPLEDSNP